MVKKVGLILALVLALAFIVGNSIFAGGPNNSSTETAIAVVGENVQIRVENPLQVTTKWMGTSLKWENGKVAPVYPGQTIGNGEITITNISPINQAAILSAKPIKVAADNVASAWPSLEVVTTSSGATYSPWQQIIVAPGATIDLKIEVKVAYGGPVSTFKGVELVVLAIPPQNRPSECKPQDCG